MKRALLAKEWVSLRPFVWLLVVLAVLGNIERWGGTLPEWHYQYTLSMGDWSGEAIIGFVLAFAMGSGLLTREHEDGTLAFLDGLPLERRDVFLSKLAVAGLCVLAYALLAPMLGLGIHHWLRHSLDEPVAASSLAALAVRYVILVAAGLSLGLLFGFVRHLAWALLAIAAVGLMVLKHEWPRAGAALDPVLLLSDGWSTQGYGGDTVWAVGGLSLLCLALSAALFSSAGGTRMQRLEALAQKRVFSVLLLTACGIAVVAGTIHLAQKPRASTDPSRHGVRPAGALNTGSTVAGEKTAGKRTPAVRRARIHTTRHYVFAVPAWVEVTDAELNAADRAYEQATEALQVQFGSPPKIHVDMAGSIEHTSGLASHNRIRINYGEGWHDTLVHETVHVVVRWLAGGERADELEKMGLLNEGLAHWSEPARHQDRFQREMDDLATATLFRRQLISQYELLDSTAIASRLDWQMRYPLGAKLVEALVKRYGRGAPARVLQTLGRPDFPRAQNGYALYRSAFQLAGFDINLVLHDLAAELRRLSEEYAVAIDAMPRPRGVLVRDGKRVGIALLTDAPLQKQEQLLVRFRPEDDSGVDEYVVVRPSAKPGQRTVAWLLLSQVASGKVCFQAGLTNPFFNAYEPWRCLPLRVAGTVAAAAPARAAGAAAKAPGSSAR